MENRHLARAIFVVATGLALLAGCAGEERVAPWTPTVRVDGNTATLTVDVPGKTMGKDYHPHLSLDGGPVEMMMTPTYSFTDLPPAHHKLVIIIVDPTHIPIKGMQRTLEFDSH